LSTSPAVISGKPVTWKLSHRADPAVVPLADRHYNRQKIGAPQFVPPGRCIVLKIGESQQFRREGAGSAYWITSWPFAEYVKHAWAGAWVNSAFRNEGAGRSSELIREAIAITRSFWKPPSIGLITFVDASRVKHKRDPGRCYLRAGFERVGMTKGGLIALQMLPDAMPEPMEIERGLFSPVEALT
jgi:hypothetical protein